MLLRILILFISLALFAIAAAAQTSSFVYQGKLQDSGAPANGGYQFQFKLYDAETNGNQVGPAIADVTATATNGIFAVTLNFGAVAFNSQDFRFLEIAVRPNGSQAGYTVLNPRQQVTSTPYAVRALSAANADHADTAEDAANLGGVPAAQYVITTDARMSDARVPLPGSPSYIQNTQIQQTASNFNISGEGRADKFSAATQFNIATFRVLTASNATGNTFVGINAGQANPTGNSNSFFGFGAGKATDTGQLNSFFGLVAGTANTSGGANSFFGGNTGKANTEGNGNSFFGTGSGPANTIGNNNSFFGTASGSSNTNGNDNSFFGYTSGYFNKSGGNNAFFGKNAGFKNTDGGTNTAIGSHAGLQNTTGSSNVFVGYYAGQSNTTENLNTFIGYSTEGAAGITNATAIGANAVVTQSNTMVLGTAAVTVQVPGSLNVANTFSANILNSATTFQIAGKTVLTTAGTDNLFAGADSGKVSTGGYNSFFGSQSGKNNSTGFNNSFYGAYAGLSNTTGTNNAFFGSNAGFTNNGSFNAFFGAGSGFNNFSGVDNSFFGNGSGLNNSTGSGNSFFGRGAGESVTIAGNNSFFGVYSGENTTTGGNSYFGAFAGQKNNVGFANTFVGMNAGKENIGGSNNTYFGANTGQTVGASGNNNTFVGSGAGQDSGNGSNNVVIGSNAKISGTISNATVIGANALATQSNTLVLGSSGIKTIVKGNLQVEGDATFQGTTNLGAVNANSLNVNGALVISPGGNSIVMNDSLDINGAISATAQANFGSTTVSTLAVQSFGIGGQEGLCFTNGQLPLDPKLIRKCASSRRYKENIQDYTPGLSLINTLRPVTFDWIGSKSKDVGFVAEEVAEAEPLLATYGDGGRVEGVKYAQITSALVNAVKEQQKQIEEQRAQIEALKALVCSQNATAAACGPKK